MPFPVINAYQCVLCFVLPIPSPAPARPKGTIVVVDWGGGGVEATVLKRTDGVLSVAGMSADASVGGGVFTDRLVAFCAKDFKRRTGGDIFESKRSVLKVCICHSVECSKL